MITDFLKSENLLTTFNAYFGSTIASLGVSFHQLAGEDFFAALMRTGEGVEVAVLGVSFKSTYFELGCAAI